MTPSTRTTREKLTRGSLRARRDTYQYRVMLNGETFAFTIDTTDKREAIGAANRKFAELMETGAADGRKSRRAAGLSATLRMDGILDEFEKSLASRTAGTQRAYKDSLKPIHEYFITIAGNPQVADVRGRDVEAFLDWRRTRRYMVVKPKKDGTVTTPDATKAATWRRGLCASPATVTVTVPRAARNAGCRSRRA